MFLEEFSSLFQSLKTGKVVLVMEQVGGCLNSVQIGNLRLFGVHCPGADKTELARSPWLP